jgi:hypothetical protein
MLYVQWQFEGRSLTFHGSGHMSRECSNAVTPKEHLYPIDSR